MKIFKKTKKIFKLTFCTIFLFTFFSGLAINFAYTVDSFKPEYGITTANVNFRFNPSTSSDVIQVIEKNTNVKIVGTIDNFYIVQLDSNKVGLLSKDYVKKRNNCT